MSGASSPAVAPGPEHVFLEEGGVLVTSGRVVAGEQAYTLREIRAVRVKHDRVVRWWPAMGFMLATGWALGPDPASWPGGSPLGQAAALGCLAWFWLGRRSHVFLDTQRGRARLVSVKSRALASRVGGAVFDALVHRDQGG